MQGDAPSTHDLGCIPNARPCGGELCGHALDRTRSAKPFSVNRYAIAYTHFSAKVRRPVISQQPSSPENDASPKLPTPGWYGVEPVEGPQPEDPYTGFKELRETQPVNLTPEGGWRLTRYDDVRRLLRAPQAGMRLTNGLLPGQDEEIPGGGLFMLLQDPPTHTRLRKLVKKAFTPRAIEAWRPKVETVTQRLLDKVAATGEMDLIDDLARPVPATLICELLGVPTEDQDDFTQWTADATHGLLTIRGLGDDAIGKRVEAASTSLIGYFNNLIEERRSNLGDDLLSVLISAEEEGDKLDPLELLSQSIGLLIAGFETTIGLIGNGLTTLIRHPDEMAKLRANPELAPSAVEECLRYSGPIVATIRVLHEDMEFGGFTIPTDAEIVAVLAAANRDPEVFEDPERFDITRFTDDKNAPAQLSFGGGAHFCLGAHLARIETEIAIRSLVERFDDLTLVNPTTQWGRSLFRVPGHVPITFTASNR
ncbi:MAG: cytochrome P450 [Myxococcota bacterium]